MGPAARVELGEVVGPHGVRGTLRVRLFGDDARHVARAGRIYLGSSGDDTRARAFEVKRVETGRTGEALLVLDGVEGREAAEALGGLLVLGDPELLEALPEGEFYWYELIGCQVWSDAGAYLGRVTGWIETGAHDVFVVQGEGGDEQLLPAAQDLLQEVDPAAGRIVLSVPEAHPLR